MDEGSAAQAFRVRVADGVYADVRFDDARLCLLALIGADEAGKKALLAVEDGYLERRGLAVGPKLAVGDDAFGFWKALRISYRRQNVRVNSATIAMSSSRPSHMRATRTLFSNGPRKP